MLGWLVDRHIKRHIPVPEKQARPDSTWPRAGFEWDPGNTQYNCTEGESLKQFRRNYSDPNGDPTGKGVAKYQALKHTGQADQPKTKCCPKAVARKNTREEQEDAHNTAKTKPHAISIRLRKKLEILFTHLKRIFGLGRLRLPGP